jgi:hypothetical protein
LEANEPGLFVRAMEREFVAVVVSSTSIGPAGILRAENAVGSTSVVRMSKFGIKPYRRRVIGYSEV